MDALPVEKRQELWDAYRQRPWQHVTTLGVLFSLVFTAGGLVYTARTWDTGQKTLEATLQGQITDRYTKAIEQLDSKATDVRIGAIYALQRIAVDSPRDRTTIRNVLAAFVRNHDLCASNLGNAKPSHPKHSTTYESQLTFSPRSMPQSRSQRPGTLQTSPRRASQTGT
ncbi:hypothetical protein [Acrocarpospora catenulata]|uniref:hypothetical protein n=1 Tax=Acrocarpospora catenulata TaxID=2836182 RepID=UPI0020239246|nr:hypothetical protein [Acrocarpospora catenulata]